MIIQPSIGKQLSHIHLNEHLSHDQTSDDCHVWPDDTNGVKNLHFGIHPDGKKQWLWRNPHKAHKAKWVGMGYYPETSIADARAIARWANMFHDIGGEADRGNKPTIEQLNMLLPIIAEHKAKIYIGGVKGLTCQTLAGQIVWLVGAKSRSFVNQKDKIGVWPAMSFEQARNVAEGKIDRQATKPPTPKFIPRHFVNNPIDRQAEAAAITADILNALEPFISRMVAQKIEKMLGASNAS